METKQTDVYSDSLGFRMLILDAYSFPQILKMI